MVVIVDRRFEDLKDAAQLGNWLFVMIDTKVNAGKLLIVVDEDCCGTLPAVLSARITAGFDRTHQAVFQIGLGFFVETRLYAVEDVLTDKTLRNVNRLHDGRPNRGFRSGPGYGRLSYDHAQLAVFVVWVGLHQLFDDGRCLVSYFEKALRHMSQTRICNGHNGDRTGSRLHKGHAGTHRKRTGRGRDAESAGLFAAADGGKCMDFRSGRKRWHGFVALSCYFPANGKRKASSWRGKWNALIMRTTNRIATTMDTPEWHKKMAEFAGKHGGITTPTKGFYFVRHGETFYNDAQVIQPVMGSQLNASGKAQAEKAGPKLKDRKFDAYYASDQERAWMTAQIIASHCGRPVHPNPDLRERDWGRWAGRSNIDLQWAGSPERGETLEEFVVRTLRGINAENGGCMAAFAVCWPGISAGGKWRAGLDNAAPMLYAAGRRHVESRSALRCSRKSINIARVTLFDGVSSR